MMSAMQAEVYQAFRAIDVPEDKALKAAEALTAAFALRDAETGAAFQDRDRGMDQMRADIGTVRTELRETKQLVERTRSELRVVHDDMATKGALAALAADAATRDDLDALRADHTALRADIKADMAALRADTKTEITALRADMKTEIMALRTEQKADITALRAEQKADITLVKLDLAAVKGEVGLLKWMLGFVLAAEIPILFKVFTH